MSGGGVAPVSVGLEGVQSKICKTKVRSLKINKGCGQQPPPASARGDLSQTLCVLIKWCLAGCRSFSGFWECQYINQRTLCKPFRIFILEKSTIWHRAALFLSGKALCCQSREKL